MENIFIVQNATQGCLLSSFSGSIKPVCISEGLWAFTTKVSNKLRFYITNLCLCICPLKNRGCDNIHKTQELHHFVMIKNLLYKNSNTIVVYLNIHNEIQFFIIYAAPLTGLISWHICNRKLQECTYLYVIYVLPSNFHM